MNPDVFVAVWSYGIARSGPHKGFASFRFLAVGRTRTEALERAMTVMGISATPTSAAKMAIKWRNQRLAHIKVMRYEAAMVLPGIAPDVVAKHIATALGVSGPPPVADPKDDQLFADLNRKGGNRS